MQSPDSNSRFNYSDLTGGELLSHTQGLLVLDNSWSLNKLSMHKMDGMIDRVRWISKFHF